MFCKLISYDSIVHIFQHTLDVAHFVKWRHVLSNECTVFNIVFVNFSYRIMKSKWVLQNFKIKYIERENMQSSKDLITRRWKSNPF